MSNPKNSSSPGSPITKADPRSRNPRKSGAYGYLARTKDGREIPSDLALIESQVIEEVELDGPLMRIKKQAIRLATASEILWGYMNTEREAFDKGLRHWGWLVGAEIRAWRSRAPSFSQPTRVRGTRSHRAPRSHPLVSTSSDESQNQARGRRG